MSTPGPKPKPTRVKELQGNPGKRALPKREPKPKSVVKKPRGMGRGLSAKFWDEHAPELERLQILTGIDGPAFRLMAEHYAFAVESAAQLREEGFTVEGRDGPKKNPLAQVFRDNSIAFKAFAEQFGMTPSARARLQLPADAEQMSLFEELFKLVNEEVDPES